MESKEKTSMLESLEAFLHQYLIERNDEKALAYVSENIVRLGTGVQEIAVNKQELRNLMLEEFAEHPDSIEYELSDYTENETSEISRNCYCQVTSKLQDENGIMTNFNTRLTASAIWVENKWVICTLHMSSATFFQAEDEFFPLKYGFETRGKINASVKKEAIELMMDMIPGGIMGGYLEPGFPLYIINDELLGYMGYTYEELMLDTKGMMVETMHPDDAEYVENEVHAEIESDTNGLYDVTYRLKRKNGDYFWVRDKGRKIKTEDGRDAIVSVMMDISETVELQKQLEEKATKDSLTNLYNRAAAVSRIEASIEEENTGVFCILDIDDFKKINDEFGHQSGDKVLILLADILKANLDEGDIAARLGGDEFIVYFTETTDAGIIEQKMLQMIETFREKGTKLNKDWDISFSAGGYVHHGKIRFSELYHKADELLYQTKRAGKGHILLNQN